MKEDTIKALIEKYEAGNSTLEEEQLLFETADPSASEFKALGEFVKTHKKTAPKNFNDTLWASFEKKTFRNNRFIKILSAAASILLLITITINSLKPKELSYAEKQALLEEALNMFPETEQVQTLQNIIYEDDLVVVYTKYE